MKYRTDLAVEGVENLRETGVEPGDSDGVIINKKKIDDDINVTAIEITDERGEAVLEKPRGRYITIEVDGVIQEKKDIIQRASKAFASELAAFISHSYHRRVLVVGLGNEKVTPDSLGPCAVSKVKITSHLFKIFDCDGDEEMSDISGLAPGVTATTGLETAELIEKVTAMTSPDAVIAIDALAARNMERVSTTIQMSDTGISPGAGMGNIRKQLSRDTLGVPVIAVGVPTVIDSATLIKEAMEEAGMSEDSVKKYLESRNMDMVVTSTDIDVIIKDFSDIIANGINITLHPGIYS